MSAMSAMSAEPAGIAMRAPEGAGGRMGEGARGEGGIFPDHAMEHHKKFANTAIAFAADAHRVAVACGGVWIVPTKMGSIQDVMTSILSNENHSLTTNAALNIFAMLSFTLLYIFELHREKILITNMKSDNSMPFDKDFVVTQINHLPKEKRTQIVFINKIYKYLGIFSLFTFLVNTVFTGYTVFSNYLDLRTIITFATCIFYILSKLAHVYSVVTADESVFLSAYTKETLQYNMMIEQVRLAYHSSRSPTPVRSPRSPRITFNKLMTL